MARLGVPVVCVISNDSSWGMISLVEKYIRPEEILPAIRRAAANGKPSIVNVPVDNGSLSPFIAPDAEMVKGK